jgi:hypothetical protein
MRSRSKALYTGPIGLGSFAQDMFGVEQNYVELALQSCRI